MSLRPSRTFKSVPEALANSKTHEQVGMALVHARKTNSEILHEIDLLGYQNAWKFTGEQPHQGGSPQAEPGRTVSMDGELTAVGKYFISVRKLDEATDKQILVSFPTNRVLKSADGDFRDTVDRAELSQRKSLGYPKTISMVET